MALLQGRGRSYGSVGFVGERRGDADPGWGVGFDGEEGEGRRFVMGLRLAAWGVRLRMPSLLASNTWLRLTRAVLGRREILNNSAQLSSHVSFFCPSRGNNIQRRTTFGPRLFSLCRMGI